MSNITSIDYAAAFEFTRSYAVIATILYTVFAIVFIVKYFTTQPRLKLLSSLPLFCLIRVSAFVIRTLMTTGDFGRDKNLLYAEIVLQSASFFLLVYTAFDLLIQWLLSDSIELSPTTLARLPYIPKVAQYGLSGLAALSIWSLVWKFSDDAGKLNTAAIMSKVVAIGFTLFTLAVGLATGYFWLRSRNRKRSTALARPINVLTLLTPFLFIRLAFLDATLLDHSLSTPEKYFYPFAILPELITLLILSIPGAFDAAVAVASEQAGRSAETVWVPV